MRTVGRRDERSRRLGVESLESRDLLTSFTSSLLKDITPGAGSSQLSNFTPVGTDKLLFNVGESSLWMTDGTQDGTRLLVESSATVNAEFEGIESHGHFVFSVQSPSGNSLWYSDGTAVGTQPFGAGLLFDSTERSSVSFSSDAFDIFSVDDNYWRFDGSSAPQHLGECDSPLGLGTLAVISCGSRLIGLDGSNAEPLVLDEGVVNVPQLHDDGLVYYRANDATGTLGFYSTDGVTPATAPIIELDERFATKDIQLIGEQIVYVAPYTTFLSQIWALNWNTGETTKLTESNPISASSHVFSRVGWLGQVNDVWLVGNSVLGAYRTDGTVEGTRPLGGIYLGEQNGEHIVASSSNVWTTDGTDLFDLQGNPFVPATPGLPPPPVFSSYALEGDSIIRTFHYSRYGNEYSVWNGSSFAEFASSVGDIGTTRFTNVGDTWYGLDGVQSLFLDTFQLRSQFGSGLATENEGFTGPFGARTPVQEISFFADEDRLNDSPLFVSMEHWSFHVEQRLFRCR